MQPSTGLAPEVILEVVRPILCGPSDEGRLNLLCGRCSRGSACPGGLGQGWLLTALRDLRPRGCVLPLERPGEHPVSCPIVHLSGGTGEDLAFPADLHLDGAHLAASSLPAEAPSAWSPSLCSQLPSGTEGTTLPARRWPGAAFASECLMHRDRQSIFCPHSTCHRVWHIVDARGMLSNVEQASHVAVD